VLSLPQHQWECLRIMGITTLLSSNDLEPRKAANLPDC
jgi:hypothetical protein